MTVKGWMQRREGGLVVRQVDPERPQDHQWRHHHECCTQQSQRPRRQAHQRDGQHEHRPVVRQDHVRRWVGEVEDQAESPDERAPHRQRGGGSPVGPARAVRSPPAPGREGEADAGEQHEGRQCVSGDELLRVAGSGVAAQGLGDMHPQHAQQRHAAGGVDPQDPLPARRRLAHGGRGGARATVRPVGPSPHRWLPSVVEGVSEPDAASGRSGASERSNTGKHVGAGVFGRAPELLGTVRPASLIAQRRLAQRHTLVPWTSTDAPARGAGQPPIGGPAVPSPGHRAGRRRWSTCRGRCRSGAGLTLWAHGAVGLSAAGPPG